MTCPDEIDIGPLVCGAADECMSPDQRNLFEQLGTRDVDVYSRLYRCVLKRIPANRGGRANSDSRISGTLGA